MKREGCEGFITKAITALCLALLTGCAAQQQREVNAAYISAQQEKAKALIACATRPTQVAECGLMVAAVYGGGGNDVVPVVRSDLDVVMNSTVGGALINAGSSVIQSNNAKEVALAQAEVSARLAESADARQVGIMQAATGSNTAIAGTVGTVATAGLGALGSVAQSANASNTANVAALADMTAALPPTTQIVAGRDAFQARDVDQSTSRDRVTGDGNETARQVDCVATGGNGGPATGTNAGSAAGTTSPTSTAYNALSSGSGAAGSNNCGGG